MQIDSLKNEVKHSVVVLLCPNLPDNRVSIALFEGSQDSTACPSDRSNMEIKMSVQQCWNRRHYIQLKG
jgi:hypothetical protein